MPFPELPIDGQTPWGNQFRAWADAVEAAAARGLIITDATVATIPPGTTLDNLAAYYNSSASAITVAGVELAAGAHAVWAWVAGAWVLLASGTTGGSEPPTEGPTTVTPTAPTANDTDATVGTLAANSYRIPASPGVDYKVGGVTKAAGDYSVGNVATSVTVTAFAQTGYVLSGTDSWTFNFAATASYVTTFYDNLTAANGTAIVGRTSSDGLATWSYVSGSDSQTASIQSNRIEASTTGSTSGQYKLTRTATASAGTPQRVRISWAYQTTGATCTANLPIIKPNGNPLTAISVTINGGNLSASALYASLTTLTGDTTGWLASGTVTLTVVGSAITITDGTRTATCSLNNATLADPQYVQFNTATNYNQSQKTYYDEPKVEVML